MELNGTQQFLVYDDDINITTTTTTTIIIIIIIDFKVGHLGLFRFRI
jgi:hypothetical protein